MSNAETPTGPVRIQLFSDVLCVWAYVSQIRVDELCSRFGDSIEVDLHFMDVFGDCRATLQERWQDRGGLAAYNDHVKSIVARFDHITVHDDVWKVVAPFSSMSCHVFLRAVGLLDEPGVLARTTWAVRQAFFRDCIDISSRATQLGIAEELGLDRAAIEGHIASGHAHADFSRDLRLARNHTVKMSPSLVFNEGRQRLAGNVGYRVIEANVRELLNNPAREASWC